MTMMLVIDVAMIQHLDFSWHQVPGSQFDLMTKNINHFLLLGLLGVL
jgi:hypothetical protein